AITTSIPNDKFLIFGAYLTYKLVVGSKTLVRSLPVMGMKDYLYRVPILPPVGSVGYPKLLAPASAPAAGTTPIFTMGVVGGISDVPGVTFELIFNTEMLYIFVATTQPFGATAPQLASNGIYSYMRRSWSPANPPYTWRFNGKALNESTQQFEIVPSGTYKFIFQLLKPGGSVQTPSDFTTWTSPNFMIEWP
ncbi:hypothetical protein H4R33_007218, partial [Dimargaris cristalligena]